MKKPIIGVVLAQMQSPMPKAVHMMQYVNETYFRGIEEGGGIPLGLPFMEDLEDIKPLLALCDGFLLPGGVDVDPRCYGEDPHMTIGAVGYKADLYWIEVTRYAVEHKKPILGICRGLQVANVALGGSLYQDVSLKEGTVQTHQQKQERSYPLHRVTIKAESHLAKVLEGESIYTNTLHHQCAKKLGQGLELVAESGDGVPEGIESPDGLILLVQWHPEDMRTTEPRLRNLFSDLVARAKQWSN